MKVLGGSDRLPSPLAGEGLGERGRMPAEQTTALAMCFRKDWTNLCATMIPSPPIPSTARTASRAGCGGAEQCSAKPRLRPRKGGGVITDINASPSNKALRPTLSFACAVQRRCLPAGAKPARQLSLRPVATGAVVEVTKRLKPLV